MLGVVNIFEDCTLIKKPPESALHSSIYKQDFYLWLQTTAQLLRSHQLDQIDFDNLIEEIEEMGRDKRRELKNRLVVLLIHLLKWHYQSGDRTWYGNSWISTIVEQRRQLGFLFEDSLSLKPQYLEVFDRCYTIVNNWQVCRSEKAIACPNSSTTSPPRTEEKLM